LWTRDKVGMEGVLGEIFVEEGRGLNGKNS